MLTCIKTGCTAYLDPYGEMLHGDLFQVDDTDVVLMRVCARDVGGTHAHAYIDTFTHWFDAERTSGTHNSTLVGRMTKFNYDGL